MSRDLRILLTGILLALGVAFFTQARFVAGQVQYLVQAVVKDGMTDEEKALALLSETHQIIKFGSRHVGDGDLAMVQRLPLRGADEAMLIPTLACGDAAGVLVRLLRETGIEGRIGQMRCGSQWGCHIFAEARVKGRWVVLDPLYGIAFRNPDGQLATADELAADWPTYRALLPVGYDDRFRYEGVRYTNWDRIPGVTPLLRRGLVAVLGRERTDGLSLRTLLLTPNRLYAWTCFLGLMVLNLPALLNWASRRRA